MPFVAILSGEYPSIDTPHCLLSEGSVKNLGGLDGCHSRATSGPLKHRRDVKCMSMLTTCILALVQSG